eukprot:GFUD01005305.1.p1 GENE.GFUD01005305.1~~GFUD01005305.1.p1  ORF type:complete len:615 (-),score=129.95 GFUD01005305.1:1319-3163(-)
MAKAKYVNPSRMGDNNIDMNMQQDVNITESVDEIIDPDLFLRSFGISDDYAENKTMQLADIALKDVFEPNSEHNQKPVLQQGVIRKNNHIGSNISFPPSEPSGLSLAQTSTDSNVSLHNLSSLQSFIYTQPQQQIPITSNNQMQNPFAISRDASLFSSPITLQQRSIFTANNIADVKTLNNQNPISQDCHVSIPLSTLQSILSSSNTNSFASKEFTLESLGQFKNIDSLGSVHRRQDNPISTTQTNNYSEQKFSELNNYASPIFSVPSPVAMSPIYVEQKHCPMNNTDGLLSSIGTMASPRTTSRPSPQSTPPPIPMDVQRENRAWKNSKSGRVTPTGKRSRPQTPTSDCDSDGGYRDREPLSWINGRITPTETKPTLRLEDMVDEDKYNKRKRSTSGGEREGRKKDPMKAMLEQLQGYIPHIGNPDEEKVSHAGLLVEGSDYIRSLMRENNATKENVEALKQKIETLNAEIEAFQEKLPEHGSSSIHRIVSTRGKSIPDMFADHVRQRTQIDWRYWVFTSIMGHFVHTFAQEVSNISPPEMEKTSIDWLQERMSLQQLRKDAFRKLAKLCSKTSIMEDPSKLPEEARGFVALAEPEDESEKQPEYPQFGEKMF